MRFGFDEVQRRLVEEVDEVLERTPADVCPRDRFALLGERRLVAVHYPENYGGRGLRLVDQAVVAERIGHHGLPDEVHLVTVQGVGCTILAAGSDAQRAAWLSSIAAGRVFASLLLSEASAGSDLAAIQTRAVPRDGGFVVTGEKAWNLHADWSAFGLCSARSAAGEAYNSISLFVIPFDAPGVTVQSVPRAMGEPFFTVSFDEVVVGRDALVGAEHRGWSIIVRAIGFERAGFDYLSRARRWLDAAEQAITTLAPAERRRVAPGLLRHECTIADARALAFRAVASADGLTMAEETSAASKLACGEAAQAVAWWAAENIAPLLEPNTPSARTLLQAAAEAPELSVSGGATELQLDLLATAQRTRRSVDEP